MRAVVFIDRNNLYYFGGGAKNALSLQIPQTSIQDMEVINPEELTTLISEFIKTNKIKPASILLCFSSQSYFQKDIPEKTLPDEIESLRIAFEDNVPFNKVLSKNYVQGKITKIIALNKDFAFTIKSVFDTMAFTTDAIVPSFALYGDQAVQFSPQVGEQLLKHFNSLQQVSFPILDVEPKSTDHYEKEFTGEKKESKSRLYVLIGVFTVLILLLVFFYFYMQQKRAPKDVTDPLVNPAVTQQVIPSSTPFPPSPTEILIEIEKDEIVIEVLNGSGTPGEADRVRDRLEEADFTNIITGNAPTQQSETASIVFKPSVPRPYKDEIVTMIKSLGFETSVRDNDEITNDVLITTYQNTSEN